eukprot:scaffold1827_cov421-Prasinococcus_capsulatus_cf.AAC.2
MPGKGRQSCAQGSCGGGGPARAWLSIAGNSTRTGSIHAQRLTNPEHACQRTCTERSCARCHLCRQLARAPGIIPQTYSRIVSVPDADSMRDRDPRGIGLRGEDECQYKIPLIITFTRFWDRMLSVITSSCPGSVSLPSPAALTAAGPISTAGGMRARGSRRGGGRARGFRRSLHEPPAAGKPPRGSWMATAERQRGRLTHCWGRGWRRSAGWRVDRVAVRAQGPQAVVVSSSAPEERGGDLPSCDDRGLAATATDSCNPRHGIGVPL